METNIQSSPAMPATSASIAAEKAIEPTSLTSNTNTIDQSSDTVQSPTTAMTAPPTFSEMPATTSTDLAVQEPPKVHPDAAEIIRQIEFYLSDDNLPGDAHLLARTGPTGDGWVSINELFGFKKMRNYKPRTLAKQALLMSDKLIVNGKFIRRKDPLTVPLHITPAINDDRVKSKLVIDKPWLTKGMLKPTGFEEGATEGPLKPEEYAAQRKLFDPEMDFTIRIEYAVTKYLSKRKMHQKTANIFIKFLLFGGFDGGQNMFTGGLDEKAMEEYDKDEIMQMKAQYGVADCVLDGLLEPPNNQGETPWSVDFESMAKAFLSSEFFQRFDWMEEQVVIDTTNVLKNFYNYLLYHDVAPEFEEDILNAREICNVAAKELPILTAVSRALPGSFNQACSTLFDGHYRSVRVNEPNAEWVHPDDDLGLSDKVAWRMFNCGAGAHCTQEQMEMIAEIKVAGLKELPVKTYDTGLEVTAVEFADQGAMAVYDDPDVKGTELDKPTGVMHCKFWQAPNQAPMDLTAARKAELDAQKLKTYDFIVEEAILRNCFPGMKLVVTIKELEGLGLVWIDHFDKVYPSFHTYTRNEFWRERKVPGPPDSWMVRANEKDAERAARGGELGPFRDGDEECELDRCREGRDVGGGGDGNGGSDEGGLDGMDSMANGERDEEDGHACGDASEG
ncbi:unnamed protein product [Zymoseptoria tritici ST99CH_1A5]|uniref:HTH La-type RNA-binding domain-containing protein n=1 Tax=Zymoseptoria tritici ST99CH_1A5 TaxID=1276529 RepID=A0A1Y6LVT2_ZYMTR|nr:unnamed protein product [Zymoseptoria tritici ST99CH_1A5]